MKAITVTVVGQVLTTATNPFESFTDDNKKTVRGSERRQAWLLLSPGTPPLEMRVPDDCPDWHDVVASMGKRISATVELKAREGGIFGTLLQAGPAPQADDEASANGAGKRQPVPAS